MKHNHIMGGCYYCEICKSSIDFCVIFQKLTDKGLIYYHHLGKEIHYIRKISPWEPCPENDNISRPRS